MNRLLILLALLTISIIPPAAAADTADWLTTDDAPPPFVVTLNETSRQYRNTCTITLRDPVYGATLGVYQCATGGFGRGSAPFGTYEIGAFRDVDDDPNHIGPRWMIRQPGLEDGEAKDPKYETKRFDLELHAARISNGTAGCLAVIGGTAVWREFMRKLNYIIAQTGIVRFVLAGNPNADRVMATTPLQNLHYTQPYKFNRTIYHAKTRNKQNSKHHSKQYSRQRGGKNRIKHRH